MSLQSQQHSVVIVGAGIAGLAAARQLLPFFPDIVIVEASQKWGGRIEQARGVLPWPVELGPEFIHGANSSLKGILKATGCGLLEYDWPDCWFFNDERRLRPSTEQDKDIEAVTKLFDTIGKETLPQKDLSAEEWLRQQGASDRMVKIADACFANDFGCSISQLGLRETILENRKWDSGETYLVLDRSLSKVVEYIGQALAGRTLLDWPVTAIDYKPGQIVVSSFGGRQLHCQYVIVTVPLTILQQEDILFRPQLPVDKLAAINRVKMSNAIKVIIVLEKPIWPDGFFDVVCPGGFIPEFWVTRYPAEEGYVGSCSLCGITGFATGERAERMSRIGESSIVHATLRQLDEIFGSGPPSSVNAHPATNAYVRSHVADWSKRPYIRGAYSYPSLGAMENDRELIAEPVGSSIFFAGEATHPAINPCIQAAYDTGIRSAVEVIEAARRRGSKL